MTTRTKTTGLILALTIIATACGSADPEIDATSQAQIDALETQIEELENAATSTAAPATTNPAETTAQPQQTSAPETTTAAPETTTTTAPATTTPPTTEPATDTSPTESLDGWALPAGQQLNAAMGPDDMDALLEDIAGPTNNMAGNMARIAPFPAVTTLPDSTIEDVTYRLSPDNKDAKYHNTNLEVMFTTTALPADVITAYQAELAAIDGASISSGTQGNDGTEFHWTRIGNFEVVAYESRAVTVVTISHKTDTISADDLAAFDGIYNMLAVPETTRIETLTLLRSYGDNRVSIEYLLDGSPNETELWTLENELVTNAGWTPTDERETSRDYLSNNTTAEIRTSVTHFEDYGISKISAEYWF